jgi:hypothetical protein
MMPGAGGMPGGGMMPGMATTTTSETEDTATAETTTTSSTSQAVTIALSVVASLAGFLITWVALGGLSHLFAIALGGQGNARMSMVLAGWASVPVGIRSVMQLIYMLATNSAISQAGLSGFAPTTTTTLSILLQQVLAQIDLYFFWQAGLLMLGIRAWSGMTRKKSFLIIVFCVLIVLMVQAGLGLGIEKLSTLSLNTSMLGGFMR